MFKIGKVLLFCLFFLTFNSYAQTNSVSTNNIYLTLEVGGNYVNKQWGSEVRLFYELNQYTAIGLETDYIDGEFYQSSGNGKLGKTFTTKYGDLTIYGLSGIGYIFNKTNRILGVGGVGIGYRSPLGFKLFGKYDTRLSFELEEDTYSNLGRPVLKPFVGFTMKF